MKIVTANGKKTLKISKEEWEGIGKKAGWMKTASTAGDILSKLDPNSELMILDSFNGAGYPREINFGPIPHVITEEDANESADCEGKVGQKVFVIGFGSY